VLEFEQFVSDPAPNVSIDVNTNMCSVGNMLGMQSRVGFVSRIADEQTHERVFGSRCIQPRHNQVSVCELFID